MKRDLGQELLEHLLQKMMVLGSLEREWVWVLKEKVQYVA
jgi:hypothetical protein